MVAAIFAVDGKREGALVSNTPLAFSKMSSNIHTKEVYGRHYEHCRSCSPSLESLRGHQVGFMQSSSSEGGSHMSHNSY